MSTPDVRPQHLQALGVANQTRLARARHRRAVSILPRHDGIAAIADLLQDPPDELASLQIGDLLQWPRRVGRHQMLRYIAAINHEDLWSFPVSESRPIGKLTFRQQTFMAGWLREQADQGRAAA